jgi:hypothetical protein
VTPSNNLEELAYELSVRALQRQETVLDELRSRTGILLTATALVASFLGARALTDGWPWLAAPGFLGALVTIVLSVYVLAPKTNLTFVQGVRAYEHFVRMHADLREAQRTLAYWNHGAWENNQLVIDRLILCFGGACGTLVMALFLGSLELGLD